MVHNGEAYGAMVRALPCQLIFWVVLGGWCLLSDPLLVELEHGSWQLVKFQSNWRDDFSFDVLRIIGSGRRRLSSLGLKSDLLRDGQPWAATVHFDAIWASLIHP